MKKTLIVFGLIVAATTATWARGSGSTDPRSSSGFSAQNGAQGFGAKVILANAPGGAYIDCDPRNPRSPVRCKPDGW